MNQTARDYTKTRKAVSLSVCTFVGESRDWFTFCEVCVVLVPFCNNSDDDLGIEQTKEAGGMAIPNRDNDRQ